MARSQEKTEKSLGRLGAKALGRLPADKNVFTLQELHDLLRQSKAEQAELEKRNSELLRAQQSLAGSQRKYAGFYEFAPAGYFALDDEMIIQETNLVGCRQLGYTRSSLQGKRFFIFVRKEDRRKFLDYWQRVLSSPEEQRCELMLLKGRKETFWAELVGKRVLNDSGEASCLAIVMDISARKREVYELLEVQNELESLARGRTEELSAAKAETTIEKERRSNIEKSLSELKRQLRELTAHLHKAREEERRGLARDIHDELGQTLVAIKMDIGWIRKEYGDHFNLSEKVRAIDDTLGMTIRSAERLMSELRPAVLDYLGLVSAADWFVGEFQKRTGIECDLSTRSKDIGVSEERATVLFRVLQESLDNVARHAGAGGVRISLARLDGKAVLTVSDNGRGIDEGKIDSPESFGIVGMRESILHCGGEFEIKGKDGEGTTLTASVPAEMKDDIPLSSELPV